MQQAMQRGGECCKIWRAELRRNMLVARELCSILMASHATMHHRWRLSPFDAILGADVSKTPAAANGALQTVARCRADGGRGSAGGLAWAGDFRRLRFCRRLMGHLLL